MSDTSPIRFENDAQLQIALRYLLVDRICNYENAAKLLGISVATIVRKVRLFKLKPAITAAHRNAIKSPGTHDYSMTQFRIKVKMYSHQQSTAFEELYKQVTEKDILDAANLLIRKGHKHYL